MGLLPDQDLQTQAQRWRLHIHQTPLAVIEWDLEGRVRSWNPAAERMFGYAAAETIGQPIIELIVPPKVDVLEQVHHISDALTREGQTSRAEHENRRKDGSIIFCRWFNTPLTDEMGQPLGVASMALDVTEIRRANQTLQESEQRFRTVADFTHDWEYWVAQDGSMVWMSPSCERITGYSIEAFHRDPELIFKVCRPEDRALLRNHVHESTENQGIAPVDFRIRHRDGHEVWINHICVPVFDNQGNPAGRRASNRDITDRKQSDFALQESEQRFRTIFEKAIDGIIIFSLEGRLLDLNDAFARMHGRTREEMRGLPITNLNAPVSNAMVPERLRRLMAGETLNVELEQINKEGRTFWTEATASLVSYAGQPAILSFHRDVTERKRSEEALVKSQAMLARTEGLAHVGSWTWEVATDTVVWSDEMFRILQRDPAEGPVAYADHPEIYHPEDMARLHEAVEAAVNKGEPYQLELRALRPSGEVRTCLDLGIPEVGSDGKVTSLFGSLQDITPQKQVEMSLRESEERLRLALEATSDGLFDWNVATGEVYHSPTYTRMLGYEPHEFVGEIASWEKWILAEDRQRVIEVNEACIQGVCQSFEVEFRMKTRDGMVKWILGRGRAIGRDEHGRALRIVGTHQDVTEKKRAENLLRESEERFRHISSSMLDIAYSCHRRPNEDFNIDWMIGATEALLGRSIEEIKAARCWGNFVVKEDMPLFLKHVVGLAPGESSTCELRLQKKDGTLTWVQSFTNCEASTGGGDHRLLGALVNITDRKHTEVENARLQAQLQQAQKMESLGTLAGGIAHDMNNVLGAILGLASANLEVQPADTPIHSSFETIAKAATRGGEMVRRLLSFARQSRVEERELNVNSILYEEVRLLERTTLFKVHLELDLEPSLRLMRGDANALTNVFMNLCVNAVDAMPENGTLTLRTRNVGIEWIEVVVEDTGTGMSEEVLARAMEPFFTTKDVGSGTGLGLSMVYSTVKSHRGQIEIQSKPGLGTLVRMRFPACEPGKNDKEAISGTQTQTPKQSLRVLLVDDDELIQSSMGMVLETLGHAVTASSSGEEALASIEAGLQPNLVILDMNMPGIGGSGTLPLLRALLPNVPVLLSTGRTDQRAIDLSKAYPLVTLLPKPFSIKAIQRCLESHGWD